MALIPGLTRKEQERVYELNNTIKDLNDAYINIATVINETDGDEITINKNDLNTIIKYALLYGQNLVKEQKNIRERIEDKEVTSFKL